MLIAALKTPSIATRTNATWSGQATSITIGKTYFSGTRVPSVLLTEYPAPEALSSAKNPPAAGKDTGRDGWKAEFERSLLENYGVTPDHYEDLGNGIYQVYVKIDGKVVPYVTVDSATGDYHG